MNEIPDDIKDVIWAMAEMPFYTDIKDDVMHISADNAVAWSHLVMEEVEKFARFHRELGVQRFRRVVLHTAREEWIPGYGHDRLTKHCVETRLKSEEIEELTEFLDWIGVEYEIEETQ